MKLKELAEVCVCKNCLKTLPDEEEGIWRYRGDPRDLRLTAERRQIRDIMRTTGKPMSPKEIGELCDPKSWDNLDQEDNHNLPL